MYAVVGCSACDALWVVETDVETTGCPRCGKRHQFRRLKQFVTTESVEKARAGRAALLAKRQGEAASFEGVEEVSGSMIDDGDYLEQSGIDSEAVAAAGEQAVGRKESKDRRTIVLEGIKAVEPATEDGIVAYAAEYGVAGADVRSLLARLVAAGEVSETGGEYRVV